MIKVINVNETTLPKIKAYFIAPNNRTPLADWNGADWNGWFHKNYQRYLVVEEVNPEYPENIAWESLSRDEFDSVYDIKHYGIGRDYSPHYEFIECYKHGFDPITQCWRRLMVYPAYEVNGNGLLRKIDDQDSEPIMQFFGRMDSLTEGWYAKLVPQYGTKKEWVWLKHHSSSGNLGEKEYKA